MELDLQILFGFHVYSFTHWLRPRKPPLPPPHLGSYARALLVSKIDDISYGDPREKPRGHPYNKAQTMSSYANIQNL